MRNAVDFGDLLRRYRTVAGLTQEGLAERAGLSARGVSDLERGLHRAPHRDTILRLAEALGLAEADCTTLQTAGQRRRPGTVKFVEPTRPQLPIAISSFVGRERELAEVRSVLARTRLLTLTGTGGIGKTRLALQVCGEVGDEYLGGVFLVELAPVGDASLVLHAVAAALGVPAQAGTPLLETLTSALRDRNCLLLLDNCEHVLEPVAELADRVLRRAPETRLLATSREPLGIDGETVWQVPPLRTFSSLDSPSEAVQLFLDRAAAIQPGFDLATGGNAGFVELICQRLDGIPLAIELAAAWIAVLGPEPILARLRASPRFLIGGSRSSSPRHKTMDAAIRWSYDLLSETERCLFARLSVFAGGFTLEAAEAVCADGYSADDILWSLRQLVAKSLVVREHVPEGDMRYRLLEPLRDFGAGVLREDQDAHAVRDRHGAFYVGLVRQSSQVISGGPAVTWNQRLLGEADNLNTALRWFLESGDVERAQLAGAALAQIWRRRGHLGDGRALLAKLMALPAGSASPAARWSLLIAAGTAALAQQDFAAARALFAEGVDVARQLGDPMPIAMATSRLSDVGRALGDLAAERDHLEEALVEARASSDRMAEAFVIQRLALVCYAAGEIEQAGRLADEALPALRGGSWTRRVAEALQVLADRAVHQGDRALARQLLHDALDLWNRVNDMFGAVRAQVELARLAADGPDPDATYALLASSVSLSADLGDRWALALALEIAAAMAAAAGDDDRAARLAGAAGVLRDGVGVPASPRERAWLERRLELVHRRLGSSRYTAHSSKAGVCQQRRPSSLLCNANRWVTIG